MAKKRKIKKWPIVVACLCIVLVLVGIWLWSIIGAKAPVDAPTRIYIPAGSDKPAIVDSLKNNLGEDYHS